MGLRTQSWASGFPPPPPQNATVSSIYFCSAHPPKRGSTWGLFLRLLDTLPPCFHLLMDLMEALPFAGTMGSQESGCLSCVGEGVFPHLVTWQVSRKTPWRLQLQHSLSWSRPLVCEPTGHEQHPVLSRSSRWKGPS